MLTIKINYLHCVLVFLSFFVLRVSQGQEHRFCPQSHIQYSSEQKQRFEQKIAEHIKRKRALKTQGVLEEAVYKIPVVVHIVHNDKSNSPGEPGSDNLSDEQIQSQIKVLTEDFRRQNADTINTPDYFLPFAEDTKIEFCLASVAPDGSLTNGITRTYTDKRVYAYPEDDAELKDVVRWPPKDYLNIWVTSLTLQGSDEVLLGYAQFPSPVDGIDGLGEYQGEETDGVAIDYRFFGVTKGQFGSSQYYNLGRTATHEVGHYLGLLHTFETTSIGFQCDGFGGDYVSDTPPQRNSNGNPVKDCHKEIIQCPAWSAENNLPIMHQNYMDYTQDECMNIFTYGQSERMRAILELSSSRNTLLTSAGCCEEIQAAVKIPFQDNFEDEAFSTDHWELEHEDGSLLNWEYYNGSDNSSLSIFNTSINDSLYASAVTPLIKFDEGVDKENPYLEFDVAYSSTINEGELLFDVAYSFACSEEWNTVGSVIGNEFVVNTGESLPFEAVREDYYRYKIAINDVVFFPFNALRFRFMNYSTGEKQVHLDNVFVLPNSTSREMVLYPNPSSGIITAYILTNVEDDVTFEVISMSGERVYFDSEMLSSGVYQLDLSDLTSGIYITNAKVGGKTIIQKIAIVR